MPLQNTRRVVVHAPILVSCVLVLAAFSFVGCGAGESPSSPDTPSLGGSVIPDTMTVVRMLETDDRFSTLRAGLDSTELDSVLATDGPYTLFAPTNNAFEALPPGTMETLLTEQQDRLRTILSHHVVPSEFSLGEITTPRRVLSLSRDSLVVRAGTDGTVSVNGSRVLDADIEASNGRIHVIESVLPPPNAESRS